MDIVFIRHGKAEETSTTGRDEDRLLTREGKLELERIFPKLKLMLPKPTLLMTSPFVRALQTAELVSSTWDLDLEICEELRQEAAPIDFFEQLKNGPGTVIYAISHQPFVSRVISWLITGREHAVAAMPRGGVAWLQSYSHLAPGGFILRSLIRPDQLLN